MLLLYDGLVLRAKICHTKTCTRYIAVRPKALAGVCCSNLPVLTTHQLNTDVSTNFLKAFSHEITMVCSLTKCSDYLPVVFFSDQGETICKTARGLEECFGGKTLDQQKGIDVQFVPLNSEELQNPTTMTCLHSHFVSLVNELSTSSNYQNTIINTISMNSIRCHGLTTCDQDRPLDEKTQMELNRVSNTPFSFFMTQDTVGVVLTYLAYILAAFCLGQAVLGLLLKLQQTVCQTHPRKCSMCQALLCLCTNLDAYLNPLSLSNGQVDRWICEINLNLQEMITRSARTRSGLELEALTSTIATLNNRLVELEGGDTTPQAVYYNPNLLASSDQQE